MSLSAASQEIYAKLLNAKLGDIKKIAKTIKKNHVMAEELWSVPEQASRLLAVLILDKKYLTQEKIEQMIQDIAQHSYDEKNQLTEWLMANQLMKSKKTIALLESWQSHSLSLLRRLFWYHQARLRWTGQTPPENTLTLLPIIETNMFNETPEVQWAMNFCAAQVGIHDHQYTDRCIALGEKAGLYKDEPFTKGCTPNYLPEFIRIEFDKKYG